MKPTDQIRDMRELVPGTAAKAAEWLRLCASKDVLVLVMDTYRTPERQELLYSQGRTAPGNVVTNARPWESMHQYRVAWDAVPKRYADVIGGALVFHKPAIDWTPFERSPTERLFRQTGDLMLLDRDWRVMAEAARALEIDWAGNWKGFIEYAHFEDQHDSLDVLLARHGRQRGTV